MEGLLATEYPEHPPYASRVSLDKPRSRKQYASGAAEHSGVDGQHLERLLVDLCTKRVEEVEAAAGLAEEVGEGDNLPEIGQEEIDALVGEPGVLERFVEDVATCSGVVGERDLLGLQSLAALSAQLDPMPNGTPLGVNVMLTRPAGRGKNRVCDAIARLQPEKFFYAFESASCKALYYAAENDPAYLKHRWLYPNEAEGADLLVEVLRPLISGGRARHRTVNKDQNGRNVLQEFDLEGPVSTTIPTIRNKLDRQLGTRMLVAGLDDYAGRVAAHSRAVSDQLSMDYAGVDHAPLVRAWQAALLALTPIRRVVVPISHPGFCFDSDEVSHGARLWTNLMGLMCAHAWIEQRNREVVALGGGGQATVATAEDYEAAYGLFAATCERSVVNISGTHRKILHALYVMQKEQERDVGWWNDPREAYKPFSQRRIAKESGVPQSTVSNNKSCLLHSLKFLEGRQDGRLRLVRDAHPSWWDGSDALDGFPKPERVRGWWHEEDGGDQGEDAADNDEEDPFTFS